MSTLSEDAQFLSHVFPSGPRRGEWQPTAQLCPVVPRSKCPCTSSSSTPQHPPTSRLFVLPLRPTMPRVPPPFPATIRSRLPLWHTAPSWRLHAVSTPLSPPSLVLAVAREPTPPAFPQNPERPTPRLPGPSSKLPSASHASSKCLQPVHAASTSHVHAPSPICELPPALLPTSPALPTAPVQPRIPTKPRPTQAGPELPTRAAVQVRQRAGVREEVAPGEGVPKARGAQAEELRRVFGRRQAQAGVRRRLGQEGQRQEPGQARERGEQPL